MFAGAAAGKTLFPVTTVTRHGEGGALPTALLPDYFFATTMVLIVAVTFSTTSTTTM
jgi:hypothetical protein